MFGRIGGPEEKMMLDMLMVDTVRGVDSTGLASIRRDGSSFVAKEPGLIDNMMRGKDADRLFKGVQAGFIGHNRAATKGEVNRKNSHPFTCGHIVGAHNGTLSNQDGLVNGGKFGTDSEALFDHIEKKGIEDAWKNMDGAAAIVWWDAKDKSLNFIRNARRPLSFAYSKDGATLFWASESWMITACGDRRIGINVGDVHIPKVNDHFRFTWSFKDGVEQGGGPLIPFVPAQLPPFEKSGPASHWDGSQYYPGEPDYEEGKEPTAPLATTSGGPRGCLDGTSTNQVTDKGMTPKAFRKKYKECTFCKESLAQEYKDSVILDQYNAVCPSCVEIAELNGIKLVGGM
jgi:hypothetical protein